MPRYRYLPSSQFYQKFDQLYLAEKYSSNHKLLDSKSMLSTLVSNLPGMAYRCKNDKNWSMQIVSKGCIELTGYAVDDLLNNNPSYESVIIDKYKTKVWDQVQFSIKNHLPFDIAYQIRTKNGQIKDVTEKGIGIYDKLGQVEAIEGFIWDDTELKQTRNRVQILNQKLQEEIKIKEEKQQKILENRRYLMDIIDAVPHLIFVKNIQGKYLLANQCLAYAYEKKITEIIGHTQYELQHYQLDELEKFLKDDREVITKGKKKFIPIERFTDRRGLVRSFQIHKMPFDYEGQQCVLGVVVDITQLVETQKAVQQLNINLEKKVSERTQELSESNRKLTLLLADLKKTQEQLIQAEKITSLARLVAVLGHQINTPIGNALTGISSLEVMAKKLSIKYQQGMRQKDFENDLDYIIQLSQISLQNVENAATLIKNFEGLSKSSYSEKKSRFNLHLYTQDIVLSLQGHLQEKNISIETQITKGLYVVTFQEIYGQVHNILIMNSLIHAFHNRNKGQILIKQEVDQKNLLICYSDDGKGIKVDDLPHIFDPFYKANLNSAGTGLGLHILYNFITNTFKGTVECHSLPNQGVTFNLNLPLLNYEIES